MNKINCLRIFLLPFSFVYFLAIKIKEFAYHSNFIKRILGLNIYYSRIPVICIGNIRVGGTGKSQIVLELAKKLLEKGNRIAILSRGYRRKSKGFFEVVSFDTEKYGDEPVLLKKNLPNAKVFVSEDRAMALQKIDENGNFDFILLDDGLQNLSFHKDIKLVLIDKNFYSKNLIERFLLPAGNLREPKKKIFDYDFVIYNKKFDEQRIANQLAQNFLLSEYRFEYFEDFEGNVLQSDDLNLKKFGAFCGIAQPESFKKLFEKLQISPLFLKIFPDHHRYGVQDFEILIKFVEKFGCNHLVTTEKDFVRLTNFINEFKRAGVFLYYAKITARIFDEENLIQKILCLKKE
ncbi:MAG: tetraacyldisaccharide 4'-kinase [Ignavibacteria bacterium]